MNNQQDNSIEKSELSWEEESKIWQAMAGADVIKDLGPISKEEYDHYNNLIDKVDKAT